MLAAFVGTGLTVTAVSIAWAAPPLATPHLAAASHLGAAAVPAFWVADDSTKVLGNAPERDSSAVWSRADGVVRLRSARNETVAFQVVLPGGAAGLAGVDATISGFASSHAAGSAGGAAFVNTLGSARGSAAAEAPQASLFREWFLTVTEPSSAMYGEHSTTGPGSYPDPLVPLDAPNGGAPFTVGASTNGAIWVDVSVSDGVAPGSWTSTVTVTSTGHAPLAIPVALTVDAISLPHEQHLPTYMYYAPEFLAQAHGVEKFVGDYFAIERAYKRMAHDHHFTISAEIYPDISGSGSSTVVDFASYHDAFCAPYLDGTAYSDGIGDSTYALPISTSNPWPADYGGIDSPTYRATLNAELRQFADHFRARGWFDRSFVYSFDEPNDPGAYNLVRKFGNLVHQSGTGWPVMVTEQPTPQDPSWGSLVGSIDIWDASTELYVPSVMATRRAVGERTWTYNGGEPGAGSQIIDTDGVAMRTWGWIAWRYGVQAWHYWQVNYFYDTYNGGGTNDVWTDPNTFDQRRQASPPSWADHGNGDGTLFYPGAPRGIAGPVSSVRMKELRRGLLDYEYLWLARANGLGVFADSVAARMIPQALGDAGATASWPRDPLTWEQARRDLADALTGARSAQDLRLTADASAVTYGHSVKLTGRVIPARQAPISLQWASGPAESPPSGGWHGYSTSPTAADGRATWSVRAPSTRWWRVTASGDASTLPAVSPALFVGVRARVVDSLVAARIALKRVVRLRIAVAPAHPHARAAVEAQRLAGGRWRSVARRRRRLSAASSATWSWRPLVRGRYRLRATFSDADHLTGFGPWRVVTVR